MVKQSLRYLMFFLTLGFLCKCTDEPEPRHVNRTIPLGFIREVPIRKGQEDFFYQNINKEANLLQLDSLETGYDSLQIRIWLGHSMASIKHVVILKLKDQEWKGQLVTFNQETENTVSSKKVKTIYPNSGWNNLIDSLHELGIVTLLHETDISGYSGRGTDGITYVFEIATLKKYRAYSYSNPKRMTNFWQARNVLKIADLLE